MAEGLSIGTLTGSIELEDFLTPALEKAAKAVEKTLDVIGELGPWGAQIADGLALVGGAVTGVAAAASIAGGAILALGMKGSTILGVEQAFDRLAEQAGSTGDALRGALLSGVKDTIDDFDAMKATSALLSSGLKVTADEFELMGKVSRELGKATGTDAAGGLEIMSGALLTGRARALQHAGILVNLKDAEEAYAKQLGVSRNELTDTQKREADRIEIMKSSQQWLDRIGVSELTFAERVQQAHMAVDNWMDSLMKGVATSPVLAAGLDAIGDALKAAFGGTTDGLLKSTLKTIDEIGVLLVDVGIGAVETARVFNTAWSALKTVVLGIETAIVGFAAALANIATTGERVAAKLHIVDGKDVALWQDSATQLTAMRDSLAGQVEEAAKGVRGMSEFDKTLDATGGALMNARDKMIAAQNATSASQKATESHTIATKNHREEIEKLTKAQAAHEKAVQALMAAFLGESQKTGDVIDATRRIIAMNVTNVDVINRVVDAIDKLHAAHIRIPKDLEDWASANRTLKGTIDALHGPLTQLSLPIGDNTQHMIDSKKAFDEARSSIDNLDSTFNEFNGGMTEAGDTMNSTVLPMFAKLPGVMSQNVKEIAEVRDHMHDTTTETELLADAFSRLGQTIGGTMGAAITGASQVMRLYSQMREGNLTGGQFATGAAGIGLGVAASAMGTPTSTGGMIAQGALSGAAAGSVGGPWGMAIGAGVGAVSGWISSMKEFHRVANDLQRDFAGIKISDDLAKSIDQLENQTGLGRAQATLTQLDKIIAEAGGLRSDNLDMFTGKLHDTFSMLQTGSMTTTQVTQILDKNFADFAAHSTDSLGLVSDKIQEIMKLDEQFGTKSSAIAQFVQQQMTTAGSKISASLTISSNALASYDALNEKQMDLRMQMGAKGVSDSQMASLQKQLDDTMKQLNQMGPLYNITKVHSQQAADAIAGSIEGVVNANMQAGMSFIDAVRQSQPAVEALEKQLTETGLNGGAAFDFLKREVQLATDPIAGPALQAIEGYTAGLVGMQNAGKMNEETFAGIASQISLTEQALESQGYSADEILPAMQNDLQTLWQLEKEYGYKVDDATQALIDQGVQSGLIGEKQQSVQQKTLDVLMAIAKVLGADIPTSAQTAADSLAKIKMPELKPVDVVIRGRFDIPDMPDPERFSEGGVVQYRASGGNILPFVPRGTDTVPAMLTPGEGIVTTRGMTVIGDEGLNRLNTGQPLGDPATERLRGDMQRFMDALPNTLARAVRDEVQKVQRRR